SSPPRGTRSESARRRSARLSAQIRCLGSITPSIRTSDVTMVASSAMSRDSCRSTDQSGEASVVVKRNAASVLAREIRKVPKGLVAISTATDPYQFVEGKYRITRHALEVLLRAQWPVSVLSRSPLMLRDLDLFRQFDDIEVGMSVPTVDDRARALLEPWAPPIEARLRCLRQLADAGLTT